MRIAVLALLIPSLALAAGKEGSRPKVAVMEIRAVQGVSAGTATILGDIVVAQVAALNRYDVMGGADISAMLGFEKQRRMLGCTESNCLAEIGGAIGASYLLAGQVGQIGSRYHLSMTLLDVTRGRVIARQAQFCERTEDALADAVQATVKSLFAKLPAPAQPLVAAQPPPAQATPAKPPEPAANPAPVLPAPAPVAAERPAQVEQTGSGGSGKGLAYGVLGGAGAALAGSGFFALLTRSEYNDFEQHKNEPGFYAGNQAKLQEIQRNALIADVLLGVGVAAGATGLWLWLRDPAPAVSIAPTSGGLSVSYAGSF